MITRELFEQLCGEVLIKLAKRQPQVLGVLTVGGLPLAELGGQLDIPVFALPTYKQGSNYHFGQIVQLGYLGGQTAYIGDESTDNGALLEKARTLVVSRGGRAGTFALMARKSGIVPDIWARICKDKAPKPYWETIQLEPGVQSVIEQVIQLPAVQRPTGLIAVGDCFTAAAELAKALGINGRYVGGLPLTKDGQPDTSYVYVGGCKGLNVLVLGKTNVGLQSVAAMVEAKQGIAKVYSLTGA